MGCDELKSPILIFLCALFKNFKETNRKSNNFPDGMDHNLNDHDN